MKAIRSRTRYRNARGFTLLECLVAVALIGIMVGGILASTTLLSKGSGAGNRNERLAVLLSAFGEALKNLDYQDCGTATQYQALFDSTEALPGSVKLIKDATNATLTVESVAFNPSGICTTAIDPGSQTLQIKATIGTTERTSTVVKRDPNPKRLTASGEIKTSGGPPCADLTNPCLSTPGDAQFVYSLSAEDIFQPGGVLRYDWVCDSVNAPTVVIQTNTYNDPSAICVYNAAVGADTSRTILLTVNPVSGPVAIFTKVVTVPGTPAAQPVPVAGITKLTAAPHDTPATIAFQSSGPEPLNGSIVKWVWNFGDSASGAQNEVVCTDVSCKDQSHLFTLAGSYSVSLTVFDNYNQSGTTSLGVVVNLVGPAKPVASFSATPGTGVVPQSVAFNASASHGDGIAAPGGISNYFWDLGNGQTINSGTSPIASFNYTTPGSYTVTLTVTATNGATNTTTRVVALTRFFPPGDPGVDAAAYPFVLSGTQFDIPLIRNGRMDFSWINTPRSPGDTVSYNIRIASLSFICDAVFAQIDVNVVAGVAGSPQSYRIQPDSGFFDGFNGLCVWSRMTWQVQTKRVSAGGVTSYSAWTSPQEFVL